MFDIGSSELLLIIIVAVVVIGPKDLPRVLYKIGQIVGKGRAMTRHFRSGIDEMIRQAEMEELEKKWVADNARIMAQTPVAMPDDGMEEVSPPALAAPGAPHQDSVMPDDGVKHDDPPVDAPIAKPDKDGYQPFVAGPAPRPGTGSAV